jgi:tetratricopeptide (TPR) repeat protein
MNPLTNDTPRAPSVLPFDGAPEALNLPLVADGEPSAVSLAYAEYWRRRAAGEAVDPEEFCNRYPGHRSALRQVLAVDEFVGDAPELFDDFPRRPYPLAGEYVCGCRLLRELGRGAFSAVYLAHDEEGNRPVVLKLSQLKTGEGRVLGSLTHDNVVPLLWANQDPDSGWYVVRTLFFGAATLTHVIDHLYSQPGDLPPANAAPIFEAIKAVARSDDPPVSHSVGAPLLATLSLSGAAARLGGTLASALAYLHGKGFAHGDLKPANVLLQAGGQPLLLDFNLSQAATPEGIGGTFPYMSPEHLRAFCDKKPLPHEQAAASDVYSLGVVLFELLTGRLPYGSAPGTTTLERAEALLARQQTPRLALHELNPRVPQRLAGLVERCLSADFAARPKAKELAETLTPKPRRLLLAGVLALLLGALVGVAVWGVIPPGEAEFRQRGKRWFEQGRQLLAEGKPEEGRKRLRQADDEFYHAIRASERNGKKGTAEDYFCRGRILLALGKSSEALNCFLQAHEAHRAEGVPHGPTLAYVGYCYSLRGDHTAAAAFGEQALAAGQRTPAVLNNLGYARMKQAESDRKQQGKREEALAHLNGALRLDADCLAAYRNRAMLTFFWVFSGNKVPDEAMLDVEAAVALSREPEFGESAELANLAATVYGLALRTEATAPWWLRLEWWRQLRIHAVRACELGADPASVRGDPLLKKWLPRELEQGPQPERSSSHTYLVEPLADR